MVNTKKFLVILTAYLDASKTIHQNARKNKLLCHLTSHVLCSNEFRWQVGHHELCVLCRWCNV